MSYQIFEIFKEKQESHFVENVESLSSKYHIRCNLQQFRYSSDPIFQFECCDLKYREYFNQASSRLARTKERERLTMFHIR